MSVTMTGQKLFEEACSAVPGGVNSPVRSFKGLGVDPMIADRGQGALIIDVNGVSRIDYCLSWGALIHGHAHPDIIASVSDQLQKGSSFGVTTASEVALAKKMKCCVPYIDQIRCVSSGTEAVMSAVRLARGYTQRPLIVKFDGNYHGHSDEFLVEAGSGVNIGSGKPFSAGVCDGAIQDMISLPYNDIKAFKSVMRDSKYKNQIAAVIVEPIAANMGLIIPDLSFLSALRMMTDQEGALLIFDEIVTGFRVGIAGTYSLYGIVPDLVCFGKIMGGGLPAAAFAGPYAIMKCLSPLGDVYQAGTLSGNPLAMQAGCSALDLLSAPGFYDQLKEKTAQLVEPIQAAINDLGVNAYIESEVGMFCIFWGSTQQVRNFHAVRALDAKMFVRYFQYMWNHRIYIPPSMYEVGFVSLAHSDEYLQKTINVIIDFMRSEVC